MGLNFQNIKNMNVGSIETKPCFINANIMCTVMPKGTAEKEATIAEELQI